METSCHVLQPMSVVYRREVVTLPLADAVKQKLLLRGYRTVADLESRTSRELIDEAGLSILEAVDVLRIATSNEIQSCPAKSLLALTQTEMQKVPTLCGHLDELMQGGVHTGRLTEFCGGPGIGKTQLGIQLCVNLSLPADQKGLGGEAIFVGIWILFVILISLILDKFYVDTEGSLSVDRMNEIVQGTLCDCCPKSSGQRQSLSLSGLSVDDVLSGIHYFRVHNYIQQLALFSTLPEFLREHQRVRLVIVDSISFHFRQGFDDMSLRMRVLNQVAQNLMALAESTNTAIVLMNQVTKRFYENSESETVPVLGDSWGQCVNTQVRLYWNASIRYAGVYKAPHLERRAVPFRITKHGIRNV